jgi:UDP-N-acetylmuramate--alanine ligase
MEKVECNKITYGLKNKNVMWSAKDIAYDDFGCASYTLLYSNEPIGNIKLSVPGLHNVSNSLAAVASCHAMGCSIEHIKHGLNKFTGTHKRFETKGIIDDIKIVDDYAHHPSEIKATLKAAKQCAHSRIWCVFQPHTYTRTKAFINDFAKSFEDADNVIISDIYAAREKDTGEVHASDLAEKINNLESKATYINGFENIVEYLVKNAAPGDLILTMGAGDISKVGEMFINNRSILSSVGK